MTQNDSNTEVFVLKMNVPVNDSEKLLDWSNQCKLPPPQGFNDFRWQKLYHDHLFVKDFEHRIATMEHSIVNIELLLNEIKQKLGEK